MNHPPHATHCQDCGASYVHIEHPLKPGVIMMSVCKCEHTNPVQSTNAPPWLQDWVAQVFQAIEIDNDDGAGIHHIVKEDAEAATFEVHLWPAPYYLKDDPTGQTMAAGDLHAHLLPIAALFDGNLPESMCFEAGAVACQGLVGGRKVILLILDMPPDVYEDEDEEVPN